MVDQQNIIEYQQKSKTLHEKHVSYYMNCKNTSKWLKYLQIQTKNVKKNMINQ